MKAVLITPPDDNKLFRRGESLGLKYLAATLRQYDIEVSVFEPTLLDWSIQDTVNAIISQGCDLLGISIQFSHGLPNAVEVMKKVKDVVSPHITIGGHFATFHYDELLQDISQLDSVVMFEGEETLTELIFHLNDPSSWSKIKGIAYRDNANIHKTPPRPLIRNLDALPAPERDNTSRLDGDSHYGMISSRGCLLCCSFCSVPSFYNEPVGPRWRVRSPQNVVDEMELLSEHYGATEISFFDDNFIGSNRLGRERAAQIAQAILDRHLKMNWSIECRVDDVNHELLGRLVNAGLRHVNLGIESGAQTVLDGFKKLTKVEDNQRAINIVRELGLSAYYHYIMFNANTTLEELEVSLDFLRKCGIGGFSTISTRLDVYKGTSEFAKLKSEGRLTKNGYEYKFQFPDPSVEFVYCAIHQGLYPLHDIEIALQRVVFNKDTNGDHLFPRNHFILPAFVQNNALDQLTKMLSDKTVDMVQKTVYYFQQHHSISVKDYNLLVAELSSESRRFSADMLKKFTELYSKEITDEWV